MNMSSGFSNAMSIAVFLATTWVILLLSSPYCSGAATNLYSLSVIDINGEDVPLDKYKGKISLVVNVASQCGYTESNYKQLVELQNKYPTDVFNVLVFPCNQYGKQEPSSNEEILTHVRDTYNINFKMYAKVNVTAPTTAHQAAPVYQYLVNATGSTPKWNFCKYLVNQNGDVVQFFTQQQDFREIEQSIQYLTSKTM